MPEIINPNEIQETICADNTSEMVHKSVMLEETIKFLNIKDEGSYLDVTLGAGGHSKAILRENKTIKLIGLDWDKDSLEKHIDSFAEEFGERATLLWGNFALIYRLNQKYSFPFFDGILADFGTSRDQIFSIPGLSFSQDSFLDMRMSKTHNKTTAADLVNNLPEKDLDNIFFEYGEERNARRIAKAIVEMRKIKRITTTSQLVKIVESINGYPSKGRIHPATKVFQALRIAVNKELDNINHFLTNAFPLLNSGGRIVCISFHSLEDRIVKNFFKQKEIEGLAKIITPRPITPTENEIKKNAPSRSAKLRVLERL